jgi:hypothetical protein
MTNNRGKNRSEHGRGLGFRKGWKSLTLQEKGIFPSLKDVGGKGEIKKAQRKEEKTPFEVCTTQWLRAPDLYHTVFL